jgi:hypothetical protein
MRLGRSWKCVPIAILCGTTLLGQQPQAANSAAPKPEASSNQAKTNYLETAAEGSIFIFDGSTKPCDEQPPDNPLVPMGSGFVAGIRDNSVQSKPGDWHGWKVLFTAGHVIHQISSIIVRINRATPNTGFVCFTIPLVHDGKQRNVFTLKDEEAADITGVLLPDVPGADPVVFAFPMLLDREDMAKADIKVGTNVFTVGYFFGYSGQKQNYPITKFGKISILTSERWYFNPDWKRFEEAYVVELQNTPGLSGAPVMTYGMEFEPGTIRQRILPPFVIGIVKGLETVPVKTGFGIVLISQGVATLEPASHLKELLSLIAEGLRKGGADPVLD